MRAPLASVLVPTFQRRTALQRLIAALGRQTLARAAFEVVVVVDGSNDGTAEWLAATAPPVTLRWLEQPNRGRAAACNAALAAARGDLAVLLDDDMEPGPEWLAAHVAGHPPGTRRALIGAVPVAAADRRPGPGAYVGRKFAAHLRRLEAQGGAVTLRDVYSGNLSIRRDVLLACGGFDPAFREYGYEDLELAWRLWAAGIAIAYSAEAWAWQHYDKDAKGLVADARARGRTGVLLATRHPEAAGELRLDPARHAGAARRALVGAVVWTASWLRSPDAALARLLTAADRLPPAIADRAYRVVLDSALTLGVRSAPGQAGGGEANPAGQAAGRAGP